MNKSENKILEKLEDLCEERALTRFSEIKDKAYRAYKDGMSLSGTSGHDNAIWNALREVFDSDKERMMKELVKQEMDKFFSRFDDISQILTKEFFEG